MLEEVKENLSTPAFVMCKNVVQENLLSPSTAK
jgi:hypothetical protein